MQILIYIFEPRLRAHLVLADTRSSRNDSHFSLWQRWTLAYDAKISLCTVRSRPLGRRHSRVRVRFAAHVVLQAAWCFFSLRMPWIWAAAVPL